MNFFYYSIASFDMLLSGCNRAIMNLQYWSEREFRPFPWGKQSFFYLSVYLNFPYLWYLHPMMCCGGDFFQNLTDFFWCDNEERSSHLPSTHLIHKVVVTQIYLFFYFMHLSTYLRPTDMCAVCYLLNNVASMTVIVHTLHTSCIVYLWCLNIFMKCIYWVFLFYCLVIEV